MITVMLVIVYLCLSSKLSYTPNISNRNVTFLELNMGEIKEGDQVEVIGKDLKGEVSFIGTTEFAQGKWIGELSTPSISKTIGEP